METKCSSPLWIGEECKGCGVCVILCPENVLVLGVGDKAVVLFQERCTQCKQCEARCPEHAIAVTRNESK